MLLLLSVVVLPDRLSEGVGLKTIGAKLFGG